MENLQQVISLLEQKILANKKLIEDKLFLLSGVTPHLPNELSEEDTERMIKDLAIELQGENMGLKLAIHLLKKLLPENEGYICPFTKVQCDDECCVSPEDCHAKSINEILSDNNVEISNQLNLNKMEHFENEQHHQAEMNSQHAEAEHNAMMEANGQAEMEAQSECKQEPQNEMPPNMLPVDNNVVASVQSKAELDEHLKKEKLKLKEGERELNFGEKLVGLTFNPSGDTKVQRAKEICAELANLVNQSFYEGEQDYLPLSIRHQLFNHTIGEILNAQMNVVKVLTFKY